MAKKLDEKILALAEEQVRELRPNVHSDAVRIAAERKARRDKARTPEGKMQKAANRQKQVYTAERRGQTQKIRGFNPRRGGFVDYD